MLCQISSLIFSFFKNGDFVITCVSYKQNGPPQKSGVRCFVLDADAKVVAL